METANAILELVEKGTSVAGDMKKRSPSLRLVAIPDAGDYFPLLQSLACFNYTLVVIIQCVLKLRRCCHSCLYTHLQSSLPGINCLL